MATDSDHIVVVRAVTISANVVPPERKEISDLIKNDPIGFSLYARALGGCNFLLELVHLY